METLLCLEKSQEQLCMTGSGCKFISAPKRLQINRAEWELWIVKIAILLTL